MSTSTNAFAGQLIATGAPAFAALTVEALFERRPSCRGRYQPNAEANWKRNIESRLADLAAALIAGHDTLFIDQVEWAKAAFAARAGDDSIHDLRESLIAMADVLERELPSAQGSRSSAIVRRAIDRLDSAPEYVPSRLHADTPHGRLAAKYLLSILEGDRHAAAELVLSAARGTDPDLVRPSVLEIFESVLLPVQHELGRMWQMNETSVGEEHFATSTTQMVVSLLYPFHQRKPRNGFTVVAGSVDGNAHEIGVRMLADLLEADGWRVIFLGASVPAEDCAQAAHDFGANLIAVSASLATQIPDIIRTVRAARGIGKAPPRILVGGAAFAGGNRDSWRSTGADGFAHDLRSGLSEATRLVGMRSSAGQGT